MTTPNRARRRAHLQRHHATAMAAAPAAQPCPHPEPTEVLRLRIAHDMQALQTRAGVHAWGGNDAAMLTNQAGRVIFVVAFACGPAGIHDGPDINILRGCANALGDLLASPADIERHRVAIQSGLNACARLLPRLSEWDLAHGAQQLDDMLAGAAGLTTDDVHQALQRDLEGQPA